MKDKKLILIWIVVTILGVLVGWVFILTPMRGELNTTKEQVSAAEHNLQIEESKLMKLKSLSEEEKQAITNEFEILDLNIPDDISDSEFFSEIYQKHVETGVTLSSLSIATDTPKRQGSSDSYEVNISGSGSLEQISSFMAEIQSMNRLLVVEEVSFSGAADTYAFTLMGKILVRL